jgi:monoamine oxidase
MEIVDFDVLIIGAGAAGLAAAMRLSTAGRTVVLIEARNRLGGRILTVEAEGVPVELGAEFIHGRAPEIFDLVNRFGLKTTPVSGDQFCNVAGKLCACDFFQEVDEVFNKLMRYRGPDINFEDFLRSVCEEETTREWARGYVAGFHGAPPDDASVEALILDAKAEEEIDGQQAWRIEGGYKRLIDCMWEACEKSGVRLELNANVERIEWSNSVRVIAGGREFKAKKAIVTLPISVLQAGTVNFTPPLDEKRTALDGIAMGDVARCVLRFRSRWWEELKSKDGKSLNNASFLFSRGADFPTWWTQAPTKMPILVGWGSAISAPNLTGNSLEEASAKAVTALATILGVNESLIRSELISAHFHDWCADPLTRGAYTYARVGGRGAYRLLAEPLRGTLFFAGEATDFTGNHATVHGAIASGYRAADEVLSTP